jgi:hypothetical protein
MHINHTSVLCCRRTCVEHDDGEGQHVRTVCIVEPAGVVLAETLQSTAQRSTSTTQHGTGVIKLCWQR